jgi:hypothetical protein
MDIPPGMKAEMELQCNGSQVGWLGRVEFGWFWFLVGVGSWLVAGWLTQTCNTPPTQTIQSHTHPQMSALQAGLDGTPLVLIQGPPGTGKTRTILNLLSVVMHAAAKGSLELMPIAGGVNENGTTTSLTAVKAAAGPSSSAAAGPSSSSSSSVQMTPEERRRYKWALQSPWMFGLPVKRDAVGPWPREFSFRWLMGRLGLVGAGWLLVRATQKTSCLISLTTPTSSTSIIQPQPPAPRTPPTASASRAPPPPSPSAARPAPRRTSWCAPPPTARWTRS